MPKKVIVVCAFIISDIVALLGSFLTAYRLRTVVLPLLFHKYSVLPLWPLQHYRVYVYLFLLWVLIFGYEKLYTKRYLFWEEVFLLIKSSTVACGLAMIILFITRQQIRISRTVIVLSLAVSLFFLPLSRYLVKILLIKAKIWNKKLLIIGANRLGLNIAKSIQNNKSMGYEIIGFLDNDPRRIGKTFSGIRVIAPISRLEAVSPPNSSIDIFIALPNMSKTNLDRLLQRCESLSESVRLVPKIGDLVTTGVEVESWGQVMTLNIKNNLAKPWNKAIKYLYEMTLALFMTSLLLPVFIFTAVAIKIDSRGPVFFVQRRIGKNKKTFTLVKFRSMYVNSDNKLHDYMESNSQIKQEWARYRKIKGFDPRVTRVGRVIRNLSIDELPQLFNVLQGTMSLVGPRPYLPEELKDNERFQKSLAKVNPGLTGLWQISGRNELSFADRITIDEYYIRNWSLWLDFTILLKTLKVFLSRRGAY